MRLVYLPSARSDLRWLRHYYVRVFPEGAATARAHILATERLILDNPHIGRPTHRPEVRRLQVARTPFFLLYRVAADRIEVLRLIDSRSFDSLLGD
jgi:plasmid stabilization system protein ParE